MHLFKAWWAEGRASGAQAWRKHFCISALLAQGLRKLSESCA